MRLSELRRREAGRTRSWDTNCQQFPIALLEGGIPHFACEEFGQVRSLPALKRDKGPKYRRQKVSRVEENNRRGDTVLQDITNGVRGPRKTTAACGLVLWCTRFFQRFSI